MRGKGEVSFDGKTVTGITPAYAGKRPSPVARALKTMGSPPPMRGKDQILSPYWGIYRITPAYAGKREKMPFVKHCPRDHPRLCGEKFLICLSRHFKTGSPPPMRGKVFAPDSGLSSSGITPAYAGKRIEKFANTPEHWDHPRLCGEKMKSERSERNDEGSPPPMRGKVAAEDARLSRIRITPAYAGKSR